jgi:hypothetical protein
MVKRNGTFMDKELEEMWPCTAVIDVASFTLSIMIKGRDSKGKRRIAPALFDGIFGKQHL